jgi:acetylornithine/LysW-gamma-L-lysine aminotransferase
LIRKNIVEKEEHSLAKTYWKRPLVITSGKGAILYAEGGKEYLDFTSNYGVAITGHSHPRVVEAIKSQAEQLISCHGTFYNEARSKFLEKITSLTPNRLNKVFLSNSGSESVESALKLARRSTGKKEIIAMMGGYHGKTMGALSATWNKKYRNPFLPLVPGFKHVPFGNLERVKEAINEETAAVIAEPIQGESGINFPPEDFLPSLRDLCNEKDILLILDEIQTGLGRTGKLFACEHWRVTPDILCLSKAVASGLPMGVTISNEEVMSALGLGEHSSTFGGGPVPCAAANATLEVVLKERLVEKAAGLGSYFKKNLEELGRKYEIVREIRGLGLMIGIQLRFQVLNIILKGIERGVLFLDAGRNVLRLLPPLVIEKNQVDQAISVLDEILLVEEAERIRS